MVASGARTRARSYRARSPRSAPHPHGCLIRVVSDRRAPVVNFFLRRRCGSAAPPLLRCRWPSRRVARVPRALALTRPLRCSTTYPFHGAAALGLLQLLQGRDASISRLLPSAIRQFPWRDSSLPPSLFWGMLGVVCGAGVPALTYYGPARPPLPWSGYRVMAAAERVWTQLRVCFG